jgi:phage tail sheath gpL-like
MPILSPNTTFQITRAAALAGILDQRVLLVGQMLAGGTATTDVLIQDIPNDSSENTLFGRRSHLAGLVRAFKVENPTTQLDVIPLDDAGAAVAGTAVMTVTGPATEDGTLFVTFCSEANHRVQIDVTSGDTETDIADAITAAYALDLDAPFTVANLAGVVTATAENGGTLSNNWGLKVEGTVAGVAIALTAWSGGTTDPVITTILDQIANIRYKTVLWPSSYLTTTIEADLNAKFNSTNAILDGVACQVIEDTLANLKTTVAAIDSQSICVLGQKTMDKADRKGSATLEMPDIACAEFCAIRSLRLETGTALTQYLTSVATQDQFGGPELASLPYFNTAMPSMPVADATDEWSAEDLAELEDNGVAVYGPNRAFSGTIMGPIVTTSLTNTAGNPDTSYKYLNTVDTASVIREFFFENSRSRYAQTRLTDGDLIPGRDMANEDSIRAFFARLYIELANDALTQAGAVALADFKDNLDVSVNVSTGTATVNSAPLLVSQLRAIVGTIQINFGGNS